MLRKPHPLPPDPQLASYEVSEAPGVNAQPWSLRESSPADVLLQPHGLAQVRTRAMPLEVPTHTDWGITHDCSCSPPSRVLEH